MAYSRIDGVSYSTNTRREVEVMKEVDYIKPSDRNSCAKCTCSHAKASGGLYCDRHKIRVVKGGICMNFDSRRAVTSWRTV